jgi:hypothetical protein
MQGQVIECRDAMLPAALNRRRKQVDLFEPILNEEREDSMRRNMWWGFCGYALSLSLCFSVALAQTVTGSITGEVTDPSGAVIAGAQVVAHDLETGVDTQTTTNGDGFYRTSLYPPGTMR